MDDKLFNTTVSKDLFSLICGKKIGAGIGREVYILKTDPTKVIKIETGQHSFQNIMEWEMWRDIQFSKHKNSFAACIDISPCGIIMIQERTERPLKKDYPKKVPHFFNDLKYSNYGVVVRKGKKHFVCHDYGNTIQGKNFTDKKKKADWWEE